MRHDYLDEHQLIAVDALCELKRICDKHGIKFYLLAGTTLGAVRHGGMIPWDDDVDVGFLSEELDKLKAVLADELDPRFEYASCENEYHFPRMFGKILYERRSCVDLFLIARWTTNDVRGAWRWQINRFAVEGYYHSIHYKKVKKQKYVKVEEQTANTAGESLPEDELAELLSSDTANEALEAVEEIYDNELDSTVDDAVELADDSTLDCQTLEAEVKPEAAKPTFFYRVKRKLRKIKKRAKKKLKSVKKRTRKKLKSFKKRLNKLSKRIKKKFKKIKKSLTGKKIMKFIRRMIYCAMPFMKPEQYIALARRNERFFETHGADCYINLYSVYGMKKERILSKWVENPSTVEFEGETYQTMGYLDEYLTHLYGNYMELPPENKRVRSLHGEIYPRQDEKEVVHS